MLTAVTRSMDAHNGSRDGDRTSNRVAVDGVRGLKHQIQEARSFREMLAAYSTDRPVTAVPSRG